MHQLDVGEADGQSACDHHPAGQEAVEQVDQSDVVGPRRGKGHDSPRLVNEYGAHGPVSSSRSSSSVAASTRCASSAAPASSTRYAALRIISSRRPVSRGSCGGYTRLSTASPENSW